MFGDKKIRNFSLSVDKYLSVSTGNKWNIFQDSKESFVSPCNVQFVIQTTTRCQVDSAHTERGMSQKERCPANLLSPLFSTPSKSHHFTFAAKGAIYYVIIAKVNFSTVKAVCYLTYQDIVCARKLTWYFFDKCLYNQNPQFTPLKRSAPLLPTIPGKATVPWF